MLDLPEIYCQENIHNQSSNSIKKENFDKQFNNINYDSVNSPENKENCPCLLKTSIRLVSNDIYNYLINHYKSNSNNNKSKKKKVKRLTLKKRKSNPLKNTYISPYENINDNYKECSEYNSNFKDEKLCLVVYIGVKRPIFPLIYQNLLTLYRHNETSISDMWAEFSLSTLIVKNDDKNKVKKVLLPVVDKTLFSTIKSYDSQSNIIQNLEVIQYKSNPKISNSIFEENNKITKISKEHNKINYSKIESYNIIHSSSKSCSKSNNSTNSLNTEKSISFNPTTLALPEKDLISLDLINKKESNNVYNLKECSVVIPKIQVSADRKIEYSNLEENYQNKNEKLNSNIATHKIELLLENKNKHLEYKKIDEIKLLSGSQQRKFNENSNIQIEKLNSDSVINNNITTNTTELLSDKKNCDTEFTKSNSHIEKPNHIIICNDISNDELLSNKENQQNFDKIDRNQIEKSNNFTVTCNDIANNEVTLLSNKKSLEKFEENDKNQSDITHNNNTNDEIKLLPNTKSHHIKLVENNKNKMGKLNNIVSQKTKVLPKRISKPNKRFEKNFINQFGRSNNTIKKLIKSRKIINNRKKIKQTYESNIKMKTSNFKTNLSIEKTDSKCPCIIYSPNNQCNQESKELSPEIDSDQSYENSEEVYHGSGHCSRTYGQILDYVSRNQSLIYCYKMKRVLTYQKKNNKYFQNCSYITIKNSLLESNNNNFIDIVTNENNQPYQDDAPSCNDLNILFKCLNCSSEIAIDNSQFSSEVIKSNDLKSMQNVRWLMVKLNHNIVSITYAKKIILPFNLLFNIVFKAELTKNVIFSSINKNQNSTNCHNIKFGIYAFPGLGDIIIFGPYTFQESHKLSGSIKLLDESIIDVPVQTGIYLASNLSNNKNCILVTWWLPIKTLTYAVDINTSYLNSFFVSNSQKNVPKVSNNIVINELLEKHKCEIFHEYRSHENDSNFVLIHDPVDAKNGTLIRNSQDNSLKDYLRTKERERSAEFKKYRLVLASTMKHVKNTDSIRFILHEAVKMINFLQVQALYLNKEKSNLQTIQKSLISKLRLLAEGTKSNCLFLDKPKHKQGKRKLYEISKTEINDNHLSNSLFEHSYHSNEIENQGTSDDLSYSTTEFVDCNNTSVFNDLDLSNNFNKTKKPIVLFNDNESNLSIEMFHNSDNNINIQIKLKRSKVIANMVIKKLSTDNQEKFITNNIIKRETVISLIRRALIEMKNSVPNEPKETLLGKVRTYRYLKLLFKKLKDVSKPDINQTQNKDISNEIIEISDEENNIFDNNNTDSNHTDSLNDLCEVEENCTADILMEDDDCIIQENTNINDNVTNFSLDYNCSNSYFCNNNSIEFDDIESYELVSENAERNHIDIDNNANDNSNIENIIINEESNICNENNEANSNLEKELDTLLQQPRTELLSNIIKNLVSPEKISSNISRFPRKIFVLPKSKFKILPAKESEKRLKHQFVVLKNVDPLGDLNINNKDELNVIKESPNKNLNGFAWHSACQNRIYSINDFNKTEKNELSCNNVNEKNNVVSNELHDKISCSENCKPNSNKSESRIFVKPFASIDCFKRSCLSNINSLLNT